MSTKAFLLGAALAASAGCATAALQPRAVYDTPGLESLNYYETLLSKGAGLSLTLKFRDDAKARVVDGELVASSAKSAQLASLRSLLADQQLALRPVYTDTDAVQALLDRAEKRSGRAQPDLLAHMVAVFTEGDDAAQRVRDAAAALIDAPASRALLEFVEIVPTHIAPNAGAERSLEEQEQDCTRALESIEGGESDTPNFIPAQGYRGADPGMEVDYANSLGAIGAGVHLRDCEYCWTYDHEDIPVEEEPGFTCHPQAQQYSNHGTASLGVTKAQDNEYGVLGAAPEARVTGFSEYTREQGYNRPRSVVAAAAASAAGDVMLLEMQTTCCGSQAYVPAEANRQVFDAVSVAVDAGVVVVAAAGNGAADLDTSTYATYASWGDSGSIIVGAGIADVRHTRASFSTWGERLDVQAWGDWSVMTGGYGVCSFPGGNVEQRHYTNGYSGTSSASALTASAATALQSYVINSGEAGLDSFEMRKLLSETGMPQGDPQRWIGPHVNLRNAIGAFNRAKEE